MTRLPIARAEWLYGYIDVLRGIGVPVERELERSAMPTWIEEMPDAYISVPLAVGWITRSGRDMAPSEIAYLAAARQSFTTFSSAFRDALLEAPTGLARMQTAMKAAVSEDSSLTTRAWREGDCIRLICDTLRFDDGLGLCLAEWIIQQATASCMRSVVGPNYCPVEMTFVSKEPPCDAASEAYGRARILVGQPHTSMLVKAADLERPCFTQARATGDPTTVDWNMDFVRALRMVIRPYLSDGHPSLGQVAEIIGMSTRALQRKLQTSGCTYSSLVDEVQIEEASELLSDRGLRIVDISLALGYGSPQNFSRVFRRITGMTPSLYRRSNSRAS